MFVLIVFIEIVLNMKRDYIVSIENPCEKILWSSIVDEYIIIVKRK